MSILSAIFNWLLVTFVKIMCITVSGILIISFLALVAYSVFPPEKSEDN